MRRKETFVNVVCAFISNHLMKHTVKIYEHHTWDVLFFVMLVTGILILQVWNCATKSKYRNGRLYTLVNYWNLLRLWISCLEIWFRILHHLHWKYSVTTEAQKTKFVRFRNYSMQLSSETKLFYFYFICNVIFYTAFWICINLPHLQKSSQEKLWSDY